MKKNDLSRFFAFLLTVSLFFSSTGFAEEAVTSVAEKKPATEESIVKEKGKSLFSSDLYVDLYSAYIWRGMVLTDEPVWQPNASLALNLDDYGSFFTTFFANFNTTTRAHHTQCGGVDEIDYAVGYQVDVSFLTLGIAHSWFTYPSITDSHYEGSTREINLSAEIANEYVIPFVEVNVDYVRADGVYALAGLRKEIQIVDQLTMGTEVALGGGTNPYTEYYFGNNSKSGLVDGNIAIFSQFDITDNVYIGARIAYMAVLDSGIRGAYPTYDNNAQDNIIWGGLTFGVTF
ncbi:MAG: hypothetical protein WCP12_11235 [bacterium]